MQNMNGIFTSRTSCGCLRTQKLATMCMCTQRVYCRFYHKHFIFALHTIFFIFFIFFYLFSFIWILYEQYIKYWLINVGWVVNHVRNFKCNCVSLIAYRQMQKDCFFFYIDLLAHVKSEIVNRQCVHSLWKQLLVLAILQHHDDTF